MSVNSVTVASRAKKRLCRTEETNPPQEIRSRPKEDPERRGIYCIRQGRRSEAEKLANCLLNNTKGTQLIFEAIFPLHV